MNSVFIRKTISKSQPSRGNDRRKAQRFQLKWPAQYRLTNGSWKGEWIRSSSLDISASGILLETREALPLGRIVEVDMEWPGIYHDRPSVRLFAVGTVTRASGNATALRTLRCEFRYQGRAIGRPERQAAVA